MQIRRPCFTAGACFLAGEILCSAWRRGFFLAVPLLGAAAFLPLLREGRKQKTGRKTGKTGGKGKTGKKPAENTAAGFKKTGSHLQSSSMRRGKCAGLLLFFCFLLGGAMRLFYFETGNSPDMRKMLSAGRAEGLVLSDTERSTGRNVVLKTGAGRISVFLPEKLLRTASIIPRSLRGYRIGVKGQAEEPAEAAGPGCYDERAYLRTQGICYKMEASRLSIFPEPGNRLIILAEKLRVRLSDALERYFPEKEAGILEAMLLGDKSAADPEMKLLYQKNGLSHILVISGCHISILAEALRRLLKRLPGPGMPKSLLLLVFLLFYGLMTGFAPPALRAVLMASLSEIAEMLHRTSDMPTALMEALLLQVLLQPQAVFAAGTLYSFLAVTAVFLSGEMYRQIFEDERFLNVPAAFRKYVKQGCRAFLTSVTVNALMTPVLTAQFYTVPLYGMVLNGLILPSLSLAVGLGYLAAAAGAVGVPGILVQIPALLCRLLLQGYEKLCGFFLRLPFAVLHPGHEDTALVLGTEAVLAAVIFFVLHPEYTRRFRIFRRRRRGGRIRRTGAEIRRERIRREICLAGLLLGIICTGLFITDRCNAARGRTVFLDVGQGDGCLIHVPARILSREGERNFLVDCGSSSEKKVGQYVLLPVMEYYGVGTLDAVFISHTDTDHINGIQYLLDHTSLYGIKINCLVFARDTEPDENMQALLQAAARRKIPIREMGAGHRLSGRGFSFTGVFPGGTEAGTRSGNDYSLILRFRRRNALQIFFTGDVGNEAEKRAAAYLASRKQKETAPALTVLKVPHHGSRYSSGPELLQAVGEAAGQGEKKAVISVGAGNSYGHPAPETLEKLEQAEYEIHRTDREHAVVLKMP